MKHFYGFFFTLFLACSTSVQSQIVINEIQASNSHVEIRNTGTSPVNIGTYWLCRFPDYNQLSTIPVICGGALLLEAGALVTVDLNYSLDAADDELALYTTSNFPFCVNASTNNMIDYVEWGSHRHTRSSVAECEGIWTNNDFVPAWDDCVSLEYDGSGNSSSDWVPQDIPSMPCGTNSLNGCGLMPLELLSFQASQIENGASISWKAVHDESIRIIALQHSMNAQDWSVMSECQPTGPDFDRGDFMHQNIASGTHYYRLHTQYSEGANELSDVAILQQCYDIDNVSIWPNPSKGMIDIFVQSIELLHTRISARGCTWKDLYLNIRLASDPNRHFNFA